MAYQSYRKDKTGVAQTAANAAATLVSAFVDTFGTFEEAVQAFNTLRDDMFEDLAKVVDADNALFASVENQTDSVSSVSSVRSFKTGGGKSASNGKVSLDDAMSLQLNFGAFGNREGTGLTLGQVLALSADEADKYGYGDGERDGRDYITWLAGDRNKNRFVQARAAVIAAAEGLEVS